jgi:hypothetical protein
MIYDVLCIETKIAFKGKCRAVVRANEFFGGTDSRDYISDVLENPTWGELFECAKASQALTLDIHHVFFENAHQQETVDMDGNALLSLSLGS